MYRKRNDAREERKRQRLEAGPVSDRYPDVAGIVVTMRYQGERASSVLRTLTFQPDSPAFFMISCLGEGCDDGGLDLAKVINKMTKSRTKSAKGELRCANRDPAVIHAAVSYQIAITYARASRRAKK